MALIRSDGTKFGDDDVARCYQHRPPYPEALHDHLASTAPGRRRALDLGCGPGKLAHALTTRFEHVEAVDPSVAMLRVARETPSAIRWLEATAEAAPLQGPYDLVTLGASVHWMDHAVLFPRLHDATSPVGGIVAIIDGDAASDTPWDAEWKELVKRWLAKLGRTYDEQGYRQDMTAHEAWLDIHGRHTFIGEHAQSPEHFIECQHSRAAWARSRMGPLADAMDAEMHELLAPHAHDGKLRFQVETRVTWGGPLASKRLP